MESLRSGCSCAAIWRSAALKHQGRLGDTWRDPATVANVRFERSLAHGYFPAEVPPSFSTAAFATKASGLTQVAVDLGPILSDLALVRAGACAEQRNFPNPLAQIKLASLCSKNWRDLQRLTARESNLTKPAIGGARRSLRYKAVLGKKPEIAVSRMPGGSGTLLTDVSRSTCRSTRTPLTGLSAVRRGKEAHASGSSCRFLDEALRESRSGKRLVPPSGRTRSGSPLRLFWLASTRRYLSHFRKPPARIPIRRRHDLLLVLCGDNRPTKSSRVTRSCLANFELY